jgi:hypothetical protein
MLGSFYAQILHNLLLTVTLPFPMAGSNFHMLPFSFSNSFPFHSTPPIAAYHFIVPTSQKIRPTISLLVKESEAVPPSGFVAVWKSSTGLGLRTTPAKVFFYHLVRALILPPSAASTAFKCVQFENYIE